MFEQVISKNYEAVSLLQKGRLEESLQLFKSVLKEVQTGPCQGTPVQQGERGDVSSISLGDIRHNIQFFKMTPTFRVFDRAFVFETTETLQNTDENASLCAAVGLYNLALNMHLKALSYRGGIIYLKRAHNLYQKVFSILRAYPLTRTDSRSTLLLATILNLIACETETCGYTSTEKWQHVYMEVFAWATADASFNISCQEEMDILTSGAVLFTCQNFCTAAAA